MIAHSDDGSFVSGRLDFEGTNDVLQAVRRMH